MLRYNSDKLKIKIENLPESSGVYKFLDKRKKIIYIGKAINLKKRVKSYFQYNRIKNSKLELLVKEINNIEVILTTSEAEALVYEASLIKDYNPKYNVELKDDKSYPFLKLTINEKYPRLFITRKREPDSAIYYGPYVNVKLLKEAVSFIKKVFPLRTCKRIKNRVCLEYHIKQCMGVCENKITEKEYNQIVTQVKKFLEGKKKELIKSLEKDMKTFSREMEYEKALFIKKRIQALTIINQLQNTFKHPIFGELEELQNVLKLPSLPKIIECFDISNISGKQAVGSMVRFVKGKEDKKGYRKFRIKNIKVINDYAMIGEVIQRRYTRLLKEKKILPDLVLIDGGKGHLNVAKNELKKINLDFIPVASIAKEYNHLYSDKFDLPIKLSPGSRLLFLIQRIRDEAHRFAITYHRKTRETSMLNTELNTIKGVGRKIEKKLLEKFSNTNNIKKASKTEFLKLGINKKTAENIIHYFKK